MSSTTSSSRVVRFVVEAAAIFLGVTLGFVADDYREQLGDRRLELEALHQLLQDLELDSADVTPMVEQSRTLFRHARTITNGAASGELTSLALNNSVDTLNQTAAYTYEPSTSAYSGLRSTGRIDLVSDAELKRAIVHYFEDRQPAILRINDNWQLALRRWLDALAGHAEVQATGHEQAFADLDVADAAALLADREMIFRTSELAGFSRDMETYVAEFLALNQQLRTRVEAYLSER